VNDEAALLHRWRRARQLPPAIYPGKTLR